MDSLTDKQAAFLREYLVDMNATEAAIRCGYSPRSAASQGSRLLSNANIQAELARLQGEATRAAVASHTEVCERLTAIIRANLGDYLTPDGDVDLTAVKTRNPDAVASADVRVELDGDGNAVKVTKLRLHDKIRAAERLAKLLGWDQPKKLDINTTSPVFILPEGVDVAGTEFARDTPAPAPAPPRERKKITVG